MSINNIYIKEDLRITKTYTLLCNSLLNLLKTSSFDKITVKDICENAMINRSTFYAHFEDKYHLLTYGLTWVIDQTSNKYFNIDKFENYDNNFFQNINELSFLYSEILLKDKNSHVKTIFHNKIVQDLNEKLREHFSDIENTTTYDIVSQFYAGAILSTITWWIENNEVISIEKMSETFGKLISSMYLFFSTEAN